MERSKRNKGGQPNNKNAVGHGAPAKSKNAEKHVFFRYLLEETLEGIQEIKETARYTLGKHNYTVCSNNKSTKNNVC